MAITVLPTDGFHAPDQGGISKTKIIFIAGLFALSLTAFVFQTEFTSQAYKAGFEEPIFLLFATHGSWWLLWPLQACAVSIFRTINKYQRDKKSYNSTSLHVDRQSTINHSLGARYHRLDSHSQLLENTETNNGEEADTTIPVQKPSIGFYFHYFKKCIIKQIHNVYHTAILVYEYNVNDDSRTENLNLLVDKNDHLSNSDSLRACISSLFASPAYRYIATKSAIVTIILTTAGFSWYVAMSMTYPSDVTAIYNCSAFTAYAFAIPILGERFSWLKVSSVVIALFGVFIVSYSGDDSPSENSATSSSDDEYPYRFWGNLLISIGAVLYGYYEVLYKKYTCIGPHLARTITPRRQATFANFIMAHLGAFTFMILGIGIFMTHVFGIHKFNLFNYGESTGRIWFYVTVSTISNLLFSASFLSLMALTSPVLSSVSSLLTIFLIGLVEWIIYGTTLSSQQLIGDVFVVIGFVILTIASWKEISEGTEDDDVENISTYSFAVSTDRV